jgi:ABC-type transport system substrate-binding protein
MRRRDRAMVTIALLSALGLSGPARADLAGTITFAIPSEPQTLDPAIDVAGPGYRVMLQVYEGLLRVPGHHDRAGPGAGPVVDRRA